MAHPEALYQAVIGPDRLDYYLERFRRFEAAGKAGASWHWPAFFVTFFWLLYRKMWLGATVYLVLFWVSMVVLQIVGGILADGAGMLAGYALHFVAVLVLPALFANALYYRHCRKKIEATSALEADPPARAQALASRGGTSIWAPVVAAVLAALLGFVAVAIMAAIALPAYADYMTRSQAVEAEAVGRTASRSVEEFYYSHGRSPSSLEEAGMPAVELPQSIRSLEVDSSNGFVRVTMDAKPLAGASLLLVPTVDAEDRITWICTSQDIEDRLLPAHCRESQ